MKRNMTSLVWTFALGMWVASASSAQVGSAGGPGSRVPGAWDAKSGTVSPPAGTLQELDLRALGVQLEAFQTIMNRDITQAFELPFMLLQDAKGTYLPGYGVMFHLEVNLHPLRTMNMFNIQPYTAEELRKAREAKLAKVRELKTRLSALLLLHATKLTEVPTDQNVAVVVHLFNMPSEKGAGLPTQLVMETSRRALFEALAQRVTAAEFEKRQTFLEF